MAVLAPMPVIEPVAVANVEALLAAIPPDRELDEPGEDWPGRYGLNARASICWAAAGNDFGAAAWPVAAGAVRVGSLEPGQDPGPVQKIVDQGIDRDQVHADFAATWGERQRRRSECRTSAIASTLSETP